MSAWTKRTRVYHTGLPQVDPSHLPAQGGKVGPSGLAHRAAWSRYGVRKPGRAQVAATVSRWLRRRIPRRYPPGLALPW